MEFSMEFYVNRKSLDHFYLNLQYNTCNKNEFR